MGHLQHGLVFGFELENMIVSIGNKLSWGNEFLTLVDNYVQKTAVESG